MTISSLVAPAIGAVNADTSVRARAGAAVTLEAPRGEIISEAPSQTPARSLLEMMRDRVVLPEGMVVDWSTSSASLSLRQLHAASPGDLGVAIP